MSIRAVVFDIGGVLEITSDLGLAERWEHIFGLQHSELNKRLAHLWSAGSIGAITYDDVLTGISATLGVSAEQTTAFMDDVWAEYLGILNAELAAYFGALRPRFQTAILSNSFVGAREREQAAYGFGDLCDFIIYSHEVGMAKPDPRIYLLTCERLGLQPNDVVFLDDNAEAVAGAKAIGMHGIQFVENAQATAAIETRIREQAE